MPTTAQEATEPKKQGSERPTRGRGMRPREFAAAYGFSPSYVYQALRDGRLPGVRIGERWSVLWQVFEEQSQQGN